MLSTASRASRKRSKASAHECFPTAGDIYGTDLSTRWLPEVHAYVELVPHRRDHFGNLRLGPGIEGCDRDEHVLGPT